jgi:hypothetical protein
MIGNGFDLHHGIASRYSDFGRYVEAVDPTTFSLIHDYLSVDQDFWNCFEERLATFDSDLIIDHANEFLVPYSTEDWSDAYHHDFEYEIEQVVQGLSSKMRGRFAKWIRTLNIPAQGAVPLISCIDPASRFLNFNYTPTLQQLYGVPDANVLHIHGSSLNPDSDIVLGHGWKRSAEEMLSRHIDEETDTRVAGGLRQIDNYFADTFKPTEKIIADNRAFFDGLAGTTKILVLGHSLAEVDAIYFEEIVKRVNPSARWVISYHEEPSRERDSFAQFGVPEPFVEFARLTSL